jgi:hypothetical protein
MKSIYDKNGYNAVLDISGNVIVTRERDPSLGFAPMVTHVGEKHTSQDWREVNLPGCPIEIKREIAKAHLTYIGNQV